MAKTYFGDQDRLIKSSPSRLGEKRNMTITRNFLNIVSLFAVARIIDVATTLYAVGKQGDMIEANPVIRATITMGWFVPINIVSSIIAFLLMMRLEKYSRKMFMAVYWTFISLNALVIAVNLFVLWLMGH